VIRHTRCRHPHARTIILAYPDSYALAAVPTNEKIDPCGDFYNF